MVSAVPAGIEGDGHAAQHEGATAPHRPLHRREVLHRYYTWSLIPCTFSVKEDRSYLFEFLYDFIKSRIGQPDE